MTDSNLNTKHAAYIIHNEAYLIKGRVRERMLVAEDRLHWLISCTAGTSIAIIIYLFLIRVIGITDTPSAIMLAITGIPVGFAIGSLGASLLTPYAAKLTAAEVDAYKKSQEWQYDFLVTDAIEDMRDIYVLGGKQLYYAYELIDIETSTPDKISVKIPPGAVHETDAAKDDPAMTDAINLYRKTTAPTKDALISILSGALAPVTHKHQERRIALSERFYQNSNHADTPLINDLKAAREELDQDIKALEADMADHLNTNHKITTEMTTQEDNSTVETE